MADGPPSRGNRRPLRRAAIIVLAVVVGFVVYAFAFETTKVSLDQIESETRREQLYRILRALAHPDLIHYDTEDLVVEAPILVPCAPDVPLPTPEGSPRLELDPDCAAPGEVVTVRGVGFRPDAEVKVSFVPKSEFAITLPLDTVQTDEAGEFTLEFEVPERPADEPQFVRAVVAIPIGSWTNRVEVWTDTNRNGVRDEGRLPDADEPLTVTVLALPEFDLRSPGGVALMDENGNPLEFLSWGGSFEATTGTAKGLVSVDLGADPLEVEDGESVQRVGEGLAPEDFTWRGPAPASFGELNEGQVLERRVAKPRPFINELALAADPRVEIAGPPGAGLEGMTLIFFDGESGGQYKSVKLADRIDLSPRLSDNALNTWDRIIETVMLALLATTVGTLLAVPLSFVAARNLMADIKVPLINLSLAIIGLPVGVVVFTQAARWARRVAGLVQGSGWADLVGIVLLSAAIYLGLSRIVEAREEEGRSFGARAAAIAMWVAAAAGGFVVLYLLADLMIVVGAGLVRWIGFLGNFVFTLGEIADRLTFLLAALVGAGVFAQLGTRLGYVLRTRLSRGALTLVDVPAAALAGALVGLAIGAVVDWFGQLGNPVATVYVPAAAGAGLGLVLAFQALRRDVVGVGLVLYYLARTVFNALRSIEPLVMVIVFVVWVGIGPFAGSLALALHTTAALAKLYSEQVESISPGPLEAIRATGATRLQTVVYAVVPQIVPPYISFTMYRWDINVRMSTIIGFAGGGGIGFLLQQNINLLEYRAAATQMLAIAIVVATMDYVSSRLRERFV